jgi:hypothetical protein
MEGPKFMQNQVSRKAVCVPGRTNKPVLVKGKCDLIFQIWEVSYARLWLLTLGHSQWKLSDSGH